MSLVKSIMLGVIVLILLGVAFAAWLAFLPNTAQYDGNRGVRIPAGSSFETVIDSLDSGGILGSSASIRLFGRVTGWGRQVKPGHFAISSGANNWAILDKIRKGRQDPIRITIPPGVRPAVMAAVLRRDLGTDSAEVREAFRDPELADRLGTDTLHLFGRMRPNTFDIFWTTDASRAIERIHVWYNRFWTDERRRQAEAVGLSEDEVMTMASIVEWEARVPDERPRIAGVYLNRLQGKTAAGRMRLQADPTVQYALMLAEGGRMRRLLFQDYRFPHPYNTYLIDGLPPGPINNPSESSIEAVLNPEGHDYLFFVADGTGRHIFTRTLAEHNRAAAEYRTMMQARRRALADSLARIQ